MSALTPGSELQTGSIVVSCHLARLRNQSNQSNTLTAYFLTACVLSKPSRRGWTRCPGLCAQLSVVHWQAWERKHKWMRAAIQNLATRWQNFTRCTFDSEMKGSQVIFCGHRGAVFLLAARSTGPFHVIVVQRSAKESRWSRCAHKK